MVLTKEKYDEINRELIKVVLKYKAETSHLDMLNIVTGLLSAVMDMVVISNNISKAEVASFVNDLFMKLDKNKNEKEMLK